MSNPTALLIIDVQVGNFEETAPVYRGTELLSKISKLIDRARAAGAVLVYVQHCSPEGAVDERGASGWKIHPAVAPIAGDVVIEKSYPDAFQDTDLQQKLDSRGIERLVITGLQTEYCIDATCRRAYNLGYNVILVKDAPSTWNTDLLVAPDVIAHHNKVLGGWFAQLKEASEIQFDAAE